MNKKKKIWFQNLCEQLRGIELPLMTMCRENTEHDPTEQMRENLRICLEDVLSAGGLQGLRDSVAIMRDIWEAVNKCVTQILDIIRWYYQQPIPSSWIS